jgi:hypothetical protein
MTIYAVGIRGNSVSRKRRNRGKKKEKKYQSSDHRTSR